MDYKIEIRNELAYENELLVEVKAEQDEQKEPLFEDNYMKNNFDTAAKIEIKQEPVCTNGSENDSIPDSILKESHTEVEIKEEGWWLGNTEVKCDKDNSLSHSDSQNQAKVLAAQQEFQRTYACLEGTKAVPYKCNICDEAFSLISDLNSHIAAHRNSQAHKCGICDRSFSRACYLQSHSMIHEAQRLHKCEICCNTFSSLLGLKVHTTLHENNKCDVCDKSFTSKTQLEQHGKTHTGEIVYEMHKTKQPFKCDICGKIFSQRSKLNKHSLMHNEERPYQCGICEKSFKRKSALKEHYLMHEDKTPINCKVCNKVAKGVRSLKRHMRLHRPRKM